MCFTEFFGNNSQQWAWHNVPPDIRKKHFNNIGSRPPTNFRHIKIFKYNQSYK